MDGRGRQQHGEDTTSRNARIIEVRHEDAGIYTIVFESEDGSKSSVRVRVEGDIISTPFGSYHVSELLSTSKTSKKRRVTRKGSSIGWLVDFEGGVARTKLPVKVVEVYKEPGESVEEGEVVLVVETMKMLNEVPSPCSGFLVEVAKSGAGVPQGGILFRVEC